LKRKYFLLILVLVLVMFLSGCSGGSGVTTAISDEAQIQNLISKMCTATSAKDWSLAKSYCYPGSSVYLMIEQVESMVASFPQTNDVRIWMVPSIYSIDITGNEATVVMSATIQLWYQGEYESTDTGPGTTILIKSGGEWYFYY